MFNVQKDLWSVVLHCACIYICLCIKSPFTVQDVAKDIRNHCFSLVCIFLVHIIRASSCIKPVMDMEVEASKRHWRQRLNCLDCMKSDRKAYVLEGVDPLKGGARKLCVRLCNYLLPSLVWAFGMIAADETNMINSSQPILSKLACYNACEEMIFSCIIYLLCI